MSGGWGWLGGGGLRVMMHNNNEDPLFVLNNNANYDLSNTLLLALGENNESNPYIDNKLNTLYFDQDLPPPFHYLFK
jgi:hypothetical protein